MAKSGDPEFGRRIADARKRKGLTQEELGRLVSVSQRTISNIEKGTREPSLPVLRHLMRVLGLSSDAALDLPPSPPRGLREELAGYLARVPYEVEIYEDLDVAAAMGAGSEPLDRIPLPARIRTSSRELYGFRARGESLVPYVLPGDILIIDPDRTPASGNYVVALVDGALMLKRYEVNDDRHVLIGNNGEIAIDPGDIRGVVVHIARDAT